MGPLLFLLYFNDIEDMVPHSETVMFAEDTVLYTSGITQKEIEEKLNKDIQFICEYLTDNDLILNNKKDKTEAMLFGTPKKLAKCDELNLCYNGVKINNTTRYKYLGTNVDQCLNLNDLFENTYKKMSARLRLLSKLRMNLTIKSTLTTYQMIIVPSFLFNCIVNLNFTRTQKGKLDSLQSRAQSSTNTEKKLLCSTTCTTLHDDMLVF